MTWISAHWFHWLDAGCGAGIFYAFGWRWLRAIREREYRVVWDYAGVLALMIGIAIYGTLNH